MQSLTFNNTWVSIVANPFKESFTWLSLSTHSTNANLVGHHDNWLVTENFFTIMIALSQRLSATSQVKHGYIATTT